MLECQVGEQRTNTTRMMEAKLGTESDYETVGWIVLTGPTPKYFLAQSALIMQGSSFDGKQ